MKKLLFFLTILLLAKLTSGQKLTGTFTSGDEHLRFYNDTVSFVLNYGGCIIYEFDGDGTYTLSKKYLLIHPLITEQSGKVSEVKRANEDTLTIQIEAEGSVSPISASVRFFVKGKEVVGQISNQENKAQLTKRYIEAVDSATITMYGYSPVAFKIEANKDYKVVLIKSKSKAAYEEFLLTKQKGFEVKLGENSIQLKRPLTTCKTKKYYWQTFTRESTLNNISFKK